MTYFSWRMLVLCSASLVISCESLPDQPQGIPLPPDRPQPAPAPTPTPQPTQTPAPKPSVPDVGPFRTSGHVAMDVWRRDFAKRAAEKGFQVATIRSVLEGIKPMRVFLEQRLDVVDQAEFSKPIWEYVGDTVSTSRLTNGRDKLRQDAVLFSALQDTYGVDKNYLTAIWGMETSYGGYMGDFDAPEALASMAVEGRRKSFAEKELYAIMRLLERGDAERDWLKAGWAGAMGHTQFMPSTYYEYAVDWTGDGTKDVWNARADALASAANYLKASGWRYGEPALREVRLPSDFNYALANGTKRPIIVWQGMGVQPANAPSLAPQSIGEAELWLPAGATGPAFLLFPNFKVIKTYNRADSYALSVSLLAESYSGDRVPSAAWPVNIDRLKINEIKQLQDFLNRLGYDAGPVDGIAGRGTRGALQRFQEERGLQADGFPTKRALADVKAAL